MIESRNEVYDWFRNYSLNNYNEDYNMVVTLTYSKPLKYDYTFGEMEPELKHSGSHRAIAFKKLINLCFPSLQN